MTREEERIRQLLLELDTDTLPISGSLVLVHLDPFGKIYKNGVRFAHNQITDAGEKCCADANADRGETQFSYMAVGTTSGGKTQASNALEAEAARVAVDSRTQGAGANDNDVVWIATFSAGTGTGALVEAGLFNDASAGDMYAYQEFSTINKGAADSLTATWTITYQAT